MYFTDSEEGETLKRYTKIKKNDLIIADRAYGTIKGISHVVEHNTEFVIRMRSNSFNLYNSQNEKFNLTEELKNWESGKTIDLKLFCKKGNDYIPIRVCALAKTEEQIKTAVIKNQVSYNISGINILWL